MKQTLQTPDPLPFPIGQPLAFQLLDAALKQNRLAPAYLFIGPSGTGKAKAARWFAAQIHQVGYQHTVTAQIKAKSHPDLIWVEPTYLVGQKLIDLSKAGAEGTGQPLIRVEQTVTLKQQLLVKAMGQRWVVVIEEAQRLNSEAGNALLKLLEDKRNCTFILLSDQDKQVLPTIRSRAQTVPFWPLEEPDYRAVLNQHCPEVLGYPSLLKYGAGSPGQAISIYQILTSLPEAARQLGQFKPSSKAEGVMLGLRLAKALSSLAKHTQGEVMRYWMDQCREHLGVDWRKALELFDQALNLLNYQVQAQGVWDLLFCQLALWGAEWDVDMPQLELEEADLSAVVKLPDPLMQGKPIGRQFRQRAVQAKQMAVVEQGQLF